MGKPHFKSNGPFLATQNMWPGLELLSNLATLNSWTWNLEPMSRRLAIYKQPWPQEDDVRAARANSMYNYSAWTYWWTFSITKSIARINSITVKCHSNRELSITDIFWRGIALLVLEISTCLLRNLPSTTGTETALETETETENIPSLALAEQGKFISCQETSRLLQDLTRSWSWC